MVDLSIIIPSLKEKYLQKTVEGILSKIEGNTEVLYEEDTGIGQRALTNKLVKQSKAKFIMKVDAHCLFSKGFDIKMMEAMDNKTIMTPVMLRLDAENWQPLPPLPVSFFCFDTDLVTQIDRERQNQELINETMSLHGSAWMIDRDTYWKWNVCDETLGSWGGQGTELGIKAFLNNGVCKVNKNCYYAHLERTKKEDFPYDRGEKPGQSALEELKKRYKNKSIAGLIEKYNFPCNWDKEKVNAL